MDQRDPGRHLAADRDEGTDRRDPSSTSGAASVPGSAAEVDEVEADEVEADEVEADEARTRYRAQGIGPVDSDERIARLLRDGERLLAVRRRVLVDGRPVRSGATSSDGIVGDLYLTSARLLIVDGDEVAIDLDDIEEAALSGERLLLVLRDGVGLSLVTDRPRLLRVQVSAARAAARTPAGPSTGSPPDTAD